ncbi:MAG TPA: sugar-binding transcriptional regulator [Propionibacteriaceae bacterium]|nr:sugar-binding transcriptional regulator [Propionibacteriaceae bacterium]
MTRNTRTDQLRLLAKIARMYYERGIRQPQIAADLNISQSRVSRLLQQASELGIVRTTVSLPSGVYTDMEEQLEARYGLLTALIVEPGGDVVRALGATAAIYLRETLTSGDILGISSCSSTLLATADAMRPKTGLVVKAVTQLVGGNGDQVGPTRLIARFANLTGARAALLPSPALVKNDMVRRALLADPAVTSVRQIWNELSVALVGVCSIQCSPLLHRSGKAIDPDQRPELMQLGAVDEVCLRFFDQDGNLINSPLNDRVMAISPKQLKAVPRRIGVAGGPEKLTAIAAAVKGGWINTLITDLETAQRLLHAQPPTPGTG